MLEFVIDTILLMLKVRVGSWFNKIYTHGTNQGNNKVSLLIVKENEETLKKYEELARLQNERFELREKNLNPDRSSSNIKSHLIYLRSENWKQKLENGSSQQVQK